MSTVEHSENRSGMKFSENTVSMSENTSWNKNTVQMSLIKTEMFLTDCKSPTETAAPVTTSTTTSHTSTTKPQQPSQTKTTTN